MRIELFLFLRHVAQGIHAFISSTYSSNDTNKTLPEKARNHARELLKTLTNENDSFEDLKAKIQKSKLSINQLNNIQSSNLGELYLNLCENLKTVISTIAQLHEKDFYSAVLQMDYPIRIPHYDPFTSNGEEIVFANYMLNLADKPLLEDLFSSFTLMFLDYQLESIFNNTRDSATHKQKVSAVEALMQRYCNSNTELRHELFPILVMAASYENKTLQSYNLGSTLDNVITHFNPSKLTQLLNRCLQWSKLEFNDNKNLTIIDSKNLLQYFLHRYCAFFLLHSIDAHSPKLTLFGNNDTSQNETVRKNALALLKKITSLEDIAAITNIIRETKSNSDLENCNEYLTILDKLNEQIEYLKRFTNFTFNSKDAPYIAVRISPQSPLELKLACESQALTSKTPALQFSHSKQRFYVFMTDYLLNANQRILLNNMDPNIHNNKKSFILHLLSLLEAIGDFPEELIQLFTKAALWHNSQVNSSLMGQNTFEVYLNALLQPSQSTVAPQSNSVPIFNKLIESESLSSSKSASENTSEETLSISMEDEEVTDNIKEINLDSALKGIPNRKNIVAGLKSHPGQYKLSELPTLINQNFAEQIPEITQSLKRDFGIDDSHTVQFK